jgi:hypothetical protein
MAAVPIQKINYTHDNMIDLIISQPGISQGALAAIFGYTQSWISTIMASDAFKERLAARRMEVVDPVLVATIEERFEAVTMRSLEVLQEKLEQPHTAVSDQLALQAAALGAKGLGRGGFGQSGGNIHVQVKMDANERLARVADRLTNLVRESREGVVDVKARVVGEESQGSQADGT